MKTKTIGLASDHAGYALKQFVKDYLTKHGMEFKDYGTYNEESCDYPDFAHPLARAVEQGVCDYGVAICSTGNGICMTVNKHQGIRGALCWDKPLAEMARKHNDANILCLPAGYISAQKALAIVATFFSTDFEGGRHERRVQKIPC